MLNFRHLAALLSRIIGVLALLALAGCSTVRTGYDNAPSIAYWWLDSYVDFNDAQTPLLRDSLAALQAWHRKHELPAYAEMLDQLQQLASGSVTPTQVCAVQSRVRWHVERLAGQAATGLAQVAPTLTSGQLRHLEGQFEKHNQQWREEWLDIGASESMGERLKKAEERAGNFYGALDDAQRTVLRQRLASSPFDARLAWRERLRRQQDLLQILREHRNSDRPVHVHAEMLALLKRQFHSPDAQYQAMLEQTLQANCHTLAALHNSTSARQRTHLMEKLRGYAADVRRLLTPDTAPD